MKASVRIMRSYDYNHFEICLGSDEEMTLDEANELRKQAALLVDEAVRQYKIAKKKEQYREEKEYSLERMLEQIERIKKKSETEWTVQEAVLMSGFEDQKFWKEHEKEDYFYGDDPERDYHFSMLRRFQNTKVRVG